MDFISNLLGKSLDIQVHKDWRDQHSFRLLKIVGHLYFFRKGALSRCSDVPSPSLTVKHTLVPTSLRGKRFQSSYCAKVRVEAEKKVEGGGGGEKGKRLPANPTSLENAP